MLIIIGIYAALVWFIFFKVEILPWNTLTKVLVSLVGLAILLVFMGLLNARTPSGRITVMSPVVEVAPVVNGTVAEIPVRTHQLVSDGDVLFTLDKRPFEYALQQAQAAHDIARESFNRLETAVEKSPAAASRQKVDEARAQYQAAIGALESARYNLDRTVVTAIGDGVLGAIRLRVGDRASAFKPVMPMLRTGEARIWGVFKQNGSRAIKVGADVGLTLSTYPGTIHWSKVLEITPGTAGGQGSPAATLIGAGDIGQSGELLVVLDWPESLPRNAVAIGSVGTATVIGADAGAVGGLAKILLKVKAWALYVR